MVPLINPILRIHTLKLGLKEVERKSITNHLSGKIGILFNGQTVHRGRGDHLNPHSHKAIFKDGSWSSKE